MYDFCLKGVLNEEINSVFEAFSDPQVISKWFAPGNLSTSYYASNFEIGGQYQAVLQSPDGFQQTIVGTYQEIKHNEHLSFTWRWDDTNDMSKVDISFHSMQNKNTRIVVVQSGFAKEQEMVHQQYAWMACLEKLSMALKEKDEAASTPKNYHQSEQSVLSI